MEQTDHELQANLTKRDGAKEAREIVPTRKAEAELKRAEAAARVLEAENEKIEADKEIAEYDEIMKGISEEKTELEEGRKTVNETLEVSQRVLKLKMLQHTVRQLRTIGGPDGEAQKQRLFPEEERQESAQVQILRMMMNKRKTGLEMPKSMANECTGERQKKRARGADRPSEPANPPKTPRTQQPKIKPEAKVAPDILKEKEVQQERRDRKRELEGVPDKWLRKEWKESRGGFSCLHVAMTHTRRLSAR